MAHRPKTLLVYRELKTLQQELLHKNHRTCLRTTHSVNSTGSQFNGASSSSSPLLPSRRCTLVLHLTCLIFLLLTVLPVFLGHLPPLTSYKSPALILSLVPALSAQLLQLFGTLFLTHSVHLVHSTLSGGTSKHTFIKQLLIPPSGILQRLRFTYVINGAL